MTVDPGALVDPREQEFWASDPTILRQIQRIPTPKTPPPVLAIGLGIAASIVAVRTVVQHQLSKKSPGTPDEARSLADKVWRATRSTWRKLAAPSISDAYKYGVGAFTIPDQQLEKLAIIYAMDLGDYFNQTSVSAMVDGFSAQLNSGANPNVAWQRSVAGYGLDDRQTRRYIVNLKDITRDKYEPSPVPESSMKALDKAILDRADRIGVNEAYKATQMGRNTVWAYMEKTGRITEGARKRWITAHDEMVCPVCAPLDGVEVGLTEPFESNGQFFYAPGVHPNCRCEIVLINSINVVKAMPGDPFDRDRRGRFSSSEQRKARPIGMTEMRPIGSSAHGIGGYSPIGGMNPIGGISPIGTPSLPIGSSLTGIGALVETPIEPKIKTQTKISNKVESKVKTAVGNKAQVKTQIKAENKTENKNLIRFHAPMWASGIQLLSTLESPINRLQEGSVIDLSGKNIVGYSETARRVGEPVKTPAVLMAYSELLDAYVPAETNKVDAKAVRLRLKQNIGHPEIYDHWLTPMNGLTKEQLLEVSQKVLDTPYAYTFFSTQVNDPGHRPPRGVTFTNPQAMQDFYVEGVIDSLKNLSANEIAYELVRAMDVAIQDPFNETVPAAEKLEQYLAANEASSRSYRRGGGSAVDENVGIILEFPKGWHGDISNQNDVEQGYTEGLYRVEQIKVDRPKRGEKPSAYPIEVRDYVESGLKAPGGTDMSSGAAQVDTIYRYVLVPVDQAPASEVIKSAPRLTLRRK